MSGAVDPRLSAPSALRNRDAILAVVRRHLPSHGLVLEIASGTGEHVKHFAEALPALVFQPSDPDPARRASIDAWCSGHANVRPALDLQTTGVWPADAAAGVLCINMIHIAPWAATVGLMAGAGRCLAPGGVLLLYGPFRRAGRHTAPSNAAFDTDLRQRDPSWGVRDLEAVEELAASEGLQPIELVEMPSNNFTVVLSRDP